MKKITILLSMLLLVWLGVANAVDTLTFTIGDTAAPHNRDYRHIASAIALGLNLVDSNKVCILNCYNDFTGPDDDSVLVISGWTTSDSTPLIIRTPSSERHAGIDDTTKWLFVCSNALYPITVQNAYTYLIGLQIEGRNTSSQQIVRLYAAGSGSKLIDCIIRKSSAGGSSNRGVTTTSSNINATVENCVIYANHMDSGVRQYYTTGTLTLYNCTIYGAATEGINGGTGTNVKAVNCLVYNNSTDFIGSFDTTNSSNNFSKDTTAVGASSIHGDSEGKTPDFVSVIADAEDFHLQSTSDAIGVGVGPDVNANVPTADIDGDARSGATCDIGFDEYVAAGGGQGVRRISGVNVKGVSVK